MASGDVFTDEVYDVLEEFPEYEGEQATFNQLDGLLEGTFSDIHEDWYPELEELVEGWDSGQVDLEELRNHVESIPSYRFKNEDGETIDEKHHKLLTAAGISENVESINRWYGTLRETLEMPTAEDRDIV